MSTHDVIKRAFASILKPKPRRTVSEHADLYRYVGTGAEKGPWRTSRTPYLREIMDSASDPSIERVTMMCSAQIGKALCVETPIPTPDGWTTMGELRVGDRVFDENGNPCTVTFATSVMYDRECFDVVFDDGSVIRADAEHRWAVNGERLGEWDIVTTKELQAGFWVPPVTARSMAIKPARRVKRVKPCDSVPVRCIQVDSPSHLFLAGRGMVPTHNTETLLNILQYYVEADPSPIVFVQPTIEAAEDFAKERLEPMIDHTPGLAEKLAEKAPTLNKVSRKKQSETLRMKHYPGGFLALVGSNSPAGLASRAARIGILDEYDRMVNNREGDPLAQLETRTITFSGNRKIVAVSTPLDKETSKIYKQFLQGDQRKLHIPCPHCGAESVWTFDDIYWDNDEQGLAIPHTIRHVCPHCKETIRGNAKAPDDLLAEGRWIPERPEIKDHRSYHVWTMHSPMVPLGEIVRLYQEADRSKDPVKRKEFVNRVLGEPYEATNVDDRLHRKLFKRREEYTAEVPDGVGLLTCGVDVQGSFLVSEVVGWGAGKESWGIEYRLWPGDPKQPRVWENLREYLRKPFRFSNGVEIQIACTFIDSGGHNTQDVYRFTRSMLEERVYAIKGVSRPGVPYVGKPSIVGTEQTILYNLGVDEGKTRIMAWANETDIGPGYCHWPEDPAKGYDEHYFRGLISERYEPIKKGDKVVYQWVQNFDRNEPLDVRNYATAAMELLNPDLDEWVSYYASLSPTESIVQESRPSGQLSKGIRL